MASVVKVKRSSVRGKNPTTSDIQAGEIALNINDGKLFSTDGIRVFEVGANLHSLSVGTGGITIANGAYSLPTSDGSANQFLQTDGAGTIAFASATVSDISDLTATATELNYTDGVTSNIQTQLNAKAPAASPTFTGSATFDTNTLYVDGTNNRVGIGTTNPAYQVEIENTGSNALLVLDRTDGAACFIEGQATRSAFGSVGATPLALAYNSLAVVTIGAGGAITVNPDGDGFTFPTADGQAGYVLKTDGNGNVTWGSTAAGAGGGGGETTFTEYKYTAANNQQSFTGSDDYGQSLSYASTDISVYLNGILLVANTDYRASNATSVWLEEPAAEDDVIQIQSFQGVTVVSVDASVVGNTATTSSTSAHVVDSFAAADWRTAKYIVQMTSGTDYHASEALIIHDGTTASITEYGTIYTNASLGSVDADINSGNVRLLVTPVNATTTVKVIRTGVSV